MPPRKATAKKPTPKKAAAKRTTPKKATAPKKTVKKAATPRKAVVRRTPSASTAVAARPRSASRERETKATLAAKLTCDEIRNALVSHQGVSSSQLKACDGSDMIKKSLVTKATKATLVAAFENKGTRPAVVVAAAATVAPATAAVVAPVVVFPKRPLPAIPEPPKPGKCVPGSEQEKHAIAYAVRMSGLSPEDAVHFYTQNLSKAQTKRFHEIRNQYGSIVARYMSNDNLPARCRELSAAVTKAHKEIDELIGHPEAWKDLKALPIVTHAEKTNSERIAKEIAAGAHPDMFHDFFLLEDSEESHPTLGPYQQRIQELFYYHPELRKWYWAKASTKTRKKYVAHEPELSNMLRGIYTTLYGKDYALRAMPSQ